MPGCFRGMTFCETIEPFILRDHPQVQATSVGRPRFHLHERRNHA